ncbi:hypothetical protein AHF37_02125 [Paragonimus kellicotti]|nr:hypothetical protein AHF37_02125 [Paragonimus kellicotti]
MYLLLESFLLLRGYVAKSFSPQDLLSIAFGFGTCLQHILPEAHHHQLTGLSACLAADIRHLTGDVCAALMFNTVLGPLTATKPVDPTSGAQFYASPRESLILAYFSLWSTVFPPRAYYSIMLFVTAVLEVLKRFRDVFIACKDRRQPAELFREFRGRDPSYQYLLDAIQIRMKSPAFSFTVEQLSPAC